MPVVIILFTILVTTSAWAEEFEFHPKKGSYRLKVLENESGIHLTATGVSLYLKKKKCNEHIVNRVVEQVRYQIKKKSFKAKKVDDEYLVTFGGDQKRYLSPRTPLGSFYQNYPREFRRVILESKFSCE